MNISCNDQQINSASQVKYLGSILDQSLSGKDMCDNVLKKVNAGLKFLYRKQSVLGYKERKLLCSAFLQPFFRLCLS